MWDMANDRDYIKIRNKSEREKGRRPNKEINTAGVICGEDLLADLIQRVFSEGFLCLMGGLNKSCFLY